MANEQQTEYNIRVIAVGAANVAVVAPDYETALQLAKNVMLDCIQEGSVDFKFDYDDVW